MLVVLSVIVIAIFFTNNRDDRSSEDRAGMGSLAGDSIQKVGENPLVDLMTGGCGQIHEADTALSRGTGPSDLPVGFHAQARKPQFKAQADALLLAQRTDSLHGDTFVVEVADDATVGLVQSDVGQGAQFMPVVGARLPRGKKYRLHTLRQEWSDGARFVRF